MAKPRAPIATRRKFMVSAGAVGVGILGAPFIHPSAAASEIIIYNGWGGSFDEHMSQAFFKPLLKEKNIEVKIFSPQSMALLKKQTETGAYQFDFCDYNDVRARQASNDGLLEKVDFNIINKANLSQQAVESAETVGGIAFSCVPLNLVYNKAKFPNGGPKNWVDFWDVKKFPGNRGFMKGSSADRMMAIALLADGVPKDKLYPLDLDRAIKKLNEIKPHLKVIWDSGGQGMQLLRDGEIDMTPMWGGRALILIDENLPLELVWEDSFIATSNWVVGKGVPNRANAWRAIEFFCDPKRLAEFAKLTYQGPINPKAFEYLSEKEAKRMASYPENWNKGIIQEVKWTGSNLNEVIRRYNQWLAS